MTHFLKKIYYKGEVTDDSMFLVKNPSHCLFLMYMFGNVFNFAVCKNIDVPTTLDV